MVAIEDCCNLADAAGCSSVMTVGMDAEVEELERQGGTKSKDRARFVRSMAPSPAHPVLKAYWAGTSILLAAL